MCFWYNTEHVITHLLKILYFVDRNSKKQKKDPVTGSHRKVNEIGCQMRVQ